MALNIYFKNPIKYLYVCGCNVTKLKECVHFCKVRGDRWELLVFIAAFLFVDVLLCNLMLQNI